MEITVRNFENSDAAAVADIMTRSFKTFLGDRNTSPSPPEYWTDFASVDTPAFVQRIFVAESDGRIIGCIAISFLKKYRLGGLQSIGVDPDIFARGCGRKLFEAAEKFWLDSNIRKAYTCVSHINDRARSYYAKMGFQQEGVLKSHFYEDVDEIQLAKFYN